MIRWTGFLFRVTILIDEKLQIRRKNMDSNNIGARIAELRKEKGMTQAELAAVINISDKAISKWESAGSCPDIDVLIKLSDFFEVSLDYIIRGELCIDRKCLPDRLMQRSIG